MGILWLKGKTKILYPRTLKVFESSSTGMHNDRIPSTQIRAATERLHPLTKATEKGGRMSPQKNIATNRAFVGDGMLAEDSCHSVKMFKKDAIIANKLQAVARKSQIILRPLQERAIWHHDCQPLDTSHGFGIGPETLRKDKTHQVLRLLWFAITSHSVVRPEPMQQIIRGDASSQENH